MRNKYEYIIPIVALIWAGSFIAVKTGVEEISPIWLAFLRFAIASPFMFLIVLIKKKPLKIPLRELPTLLALALTGVTLMYILQYVGIKNTTAVNAAILINTNVIFITILSALTLKEKFSRKKYVGVMLSFTGAFLVIINNFSFSLTLSLKGDLLVVFSAICWAIYSLIGKKIFERYDPITVNTYVFILGTLLFIPFVNMNSINASISLQGWIMVFYLVLPCSVFAYLAWCYALTVMDATKVGVYLNLIPLFAMSLSYLILKEDITLLLLIGAALIIYGIYSTERG